MLRWILELIHIVAIGKYQIYKLISRHRVAQYELVGLIFFGRFFMDFLVDSLRIYLQIFVDFFVDFCGFFVDFLWKFFNS